MFTKPLRCALVLACSFAAPARSDDALDDALARVGLRRADLGWTPKGWWSRFPAEIPYKLRCFDALLAEPLDTVPFARALADAVREQLDPAKLDAPAERFGGNLYNVVHRLGTNPKFGGLRGYAANLTAGDTPLDEALLTLIRAAQRPTRFLSTGMEVPYPLPPKELADKMAVIPPDARPILGRLMLNIVDAHHWAELAFRKVDGADRLTVSRRYNLGEEQVDALDYCPAIDDVARAWDEPSMWYAAEKCVQALDDARIALAKLPPAPPFAFDYESPWGWIRIRGGGNDEVDGTDALLIVDLGGDDHYTGPVAASTADRPIGLLLDLAGNDRYSSATLPAQGAGMCGVGILLDNAGDDTYEAERYAQGVGQFGFGVCADLGGNDRYSVHFSGQGCGYFGIGLLLDAAWNDAYAIYCDGQGLGGVAGVGVLADRSGDDTYVAERDSRITGRPSYHSPNENISVSNVQGCAMGRRGDGADGHSWAGGLGALLDEGGNDRYSSGNWSQGTGYWFGIGLLHDGGGNDEYHGVVWSQATGAHFCLGVLIDEAGDDLHIAEATSNNSIAFGHDFTVALLLNIGGNDRYETKNGGLGYSINRSVAALIDIGGDDVYVAKEGNRPGVAIFDEQRFRAHDGVMTYFADATSLGLFLDIGGQDSYWNGAANDSTWLDPPDAPNWSVHNFSVGVDRAAGEVRFAPRPVKPPTGPATQPASPAAPPAIPR